MHLLGVHRYFRAAFIVSESVFHVLNDSSRVLSVSQGMRFWETSRIFWTIHSVSRGMLNRIPSGFCTSFLPRSTLECLLYSPGLKGYSNKLVPQIRIVAKRNKQAFAFVVGDPGEEISWDLFDISNCFPAEGKQWLLEKWLQENVVSFMMLNRCNKLCHSPLEKLPFVRMSASWFLDSTYLIWTCGSRLILSNNQSRATRWVRDTCLIVGLPPLMIIFITASLSSKMYNVDSFSERCAFEGTWSVFHRSTFWSNTCLILGVFGISTQVSRVHAWVGFGILWVAPSTSITKSHKSSAGKTIHTQTSIQRIRSLILWSCEILTFASCTSNWSVQMFDFPKWCVLSLQDILQSLNLEIAPTDNVEPHCPHDNIGGNHSWNECRQLIVPVVCHMLESILWQIVPVCWLTTECQVDQFVPGTSILIQYGSKLPTIHLNFPVLPFWFGDRPNKDEKLCTVAPFFCQFAIPFHAFSSMSFHVVGPHWSFCARFVPSW